MLFGKVEVFQSVPVQWTVGSIFNYYVCIVKKKFFLNEGVYKNHYDKSSSAQETLRLENFER